jgi:hypothetical protein
MCSEHVLAGVMGHHGFIITTFQLFRRYAARPIIVSGKSSSGVRAPQAGLTG